MIKLDQQLRKKSTAFTLVELVVAIGIFSSIILVMFGVLGDSVGRMTNASSNSLQRRIGQAVISEIMQSEWADVHTFNRPNNSTRYFDAQGIETEGFTQETVFTARIVVNPRDVNIDQNRSLELSDQSSAVTHSLSDDGTITNSTNQFTRRIVIQITDAPIESFDFDDPKNQSFIFSIGTVVTSFDELPLR